MTEKNSNARANERSNVFLSAVLKTATRSFPVRIRNLSAGGALLDGENLPAEGSAVSLRRAHLVVAGIVVWQAHLLRGIHFGNEIDVDEWVKLKGHAGQHRVDQLVAAIRTGNHQADLTRESPDDGTGAETMESISLALEQMCERISNSPSLTDEIAEELVRLDSIIHSLRQLARSKATGS
jgi:hypothetical protein